MFEEFTSEPIKPPILERWFAPSVAPSFVRARWIWLRCLGGIFFSAFYSLYFQIHGLIGPRGILPAGQYLDAVHRALGAKGYWYAPTLLWFNASDAMLSAIVWIGLAASIAIVINVGPRLSIAIAGICFLSFVGAAQDSPAINRTACSSRPRCCRSFSRLAASVRSSVSISRRRARPSSCCS